MEAAGQPNEGSNNMRFSFFFPLIFFLSVLLDSSPAHWSTGPPGKLPLLQMACLPLIANIHASGILKSYITKAVAPKTSNKTTKNDLSNLPTDYKRT